MIHLVPNDLILDDIMVRESDDRNDESNDGSVMPNQSKNGLVDHIYLGKLTVDEVLDISEQAEI